MAVYRETRKTNPLLIGGIIVVVVVLVVVGFLLLSSRSTPAASTPLADAQAKAQEAANGLDVFIIEYPKLTRGEKLSGAGGALSRAEQSFGSAQSDLSKLDAAGVTQLAADFKSLDAKF